MHRPLPSYFLLEIGRRRVLAIYKAYFMKQVSSLYCVHFCALHASLDMRFGVCLCRFRLCPGLVCVYLFTFWVLFLRRFLVLWALCVNSLFVWTLLVQTPSLSGPWVWAISRQICSVLEVFAWTHLFWTLFVPIYLRVWGCLCISCVWALFV